MSYGATWGRRITATSFRRWRGVLVAAGLVAALSAWLASGLRPAAKLDSVLARDDPAAAALARITSEFDIADELILLVSCDAPTDAEARAELIGFAQRLEAAIRASDDTSRMCAAVHYRPSEQFRSFAAEVLAPNALHYLSSDAAELLLSKLTPGAMLGALQRLERALAVPGAGGAVTRKLARDPLGLREVLSLQPGGSKPMFAGSTEPFFSDDNRHLLVRIAGTEPSSDLAFSAALVDAVSGVHDEVRSGGVQVEVTGAYAIAAAAQQSIRADMIRSIVCSVLLLQLLFVAAYRDIWTLPLALAPVAVGILFGFAALRLLGMTLSPITAVAGALLAGLGIDYAIHYLSHYRSRRTEGLAPEAALLETGQHLTSALLAACVTTLIGFGAVSMSRVDALREFAVLGAIGLGASFVSTVIVLPALLHRAGRFVTTRAAGRRRSDRSATRRVVAIILRRPRICVGATVAIALFCGLSLCLAGSSSRLFESDLTVMHPRPNRPLDVQQRVADLFGIAPDPLLVLIEAESDSALVASAHDVRAAVQQLDIGRPAEAADGDSNALDASSGISSFGLADLLPDPRQTEVHRARISIGQGVAVRTAFEEAIAQTSLDPAAFADYADFLARVVAPGPSPTLADLSRFPDVAEPFLPSRAAAPTEAGALRAGLVYVRYGAPLGDRRERDELIASLRAAIAPIATATLTGLPVVGHDTERAIRTDLRRLLTAATGLVVVWLLLVYRRIKPVLLTFVPVAFGLLILSSSMLLFDIRLNMVNLIALPLVVGVGVDDGILLVSSALAARRASGGSGSLAAELSASCEAICMTSLTTVLTFGTLAMTSTPAIRSLGWVMGIGVLADLFATLFLLVPLLARSGSDRAAPAG